MNNKKIKLKLIYSSFKSYIFMYELRFWKKKFVHRKNVWLKSNICMIRTFLCMYEFIHKYDSYIFCMNHTKWMNTVISHLGSWIFWVINKRLFAVPLLYMNPDCSLTMGIDEPRLFFNNGSPLFLFLKTPPL